jgi:hypothetical protein
MRFAGELWMVRQDVFETWDSPRVVSILSKKMGRAYSRPTTGTARRPERTLSARPNRGVPQTLSFMVNWRFCRRQQSKLREIKIWDQSR